MKFNKERTIEIKENLKILPIWKLSIFLGNLETNILELKKQGVNSNSSQMTKKRCLRGMYRRELLNKLQDWEKGKEDKIDFSDTINLDLDKDKMEIEDYNENRIN